LAEEKACILAQHPGDMLGKVPCLFLPWRPVNSASHMKQRPMLAELYEACQQRFVWVLTKNSDMSNTGSDTVASKTVWSYRLQPIAPASDTVASKLNWIELIR